MNYDAKYQAAKKRVAALDALDGFKDRNLRTIVAALEAGLRKPESNCHFEALVMLQEVAKRAKP